MRYDLVGGARDAFLRRIRLGGGDADQLEPAEREHDDGHGHHQATQTVREKAAQLPQIGHAGLRAAVAAGQQISAEADHGHDGADLDDGEPELHLAEQLDVEQVDHVDQHKEHQRRNPGGHARPPVLHVDAHRRELGHAHQHIQHPVVPARDKTRERPPVAVGEVAERTGHRLLDHHLAQLPHDQEGDHAGDRITQDDRRSGQLDGLRNAEEQTGSDGAPQGNQLNVTIAQPSFERVLVFGLAHGK